jgi:hypothetical protein
MILNSNGEINDLSVADFQSTQLENTVSPTAEGSVNRLAYVKSLLPSSSQSLSPSNASLNSTTIDRRHLPVTTDQLMANGTPTNTNTIVETPAGQFFGSDFARNGPLIENIFEVEVKYPPLSPSLSPSPFLTFSPVDLEQ